MSARDLPLRHSRVIAVLFLAFAGAMAPGLARLQYDNAPEVFFVSDAASLGHYRNLELSFGRDRGVRAVVSGEGLWSREGLDFLRRIEEGADALPGVAGAAGLYRHHRWRLPVWPPEDPATFRDEVLADPVDRNGGWVSRDGGTATALVGLVPLDPGQRRRVLGELARLLERSPAGVEAHLVGLPQITQALDEALFDLARKLFPVVILLAAALLALIFRNLSDVLAPLVLVAVTEVVVFGAWGYSGVRLDFVNIVLAPLLFVLTLATAVHLLASWRRLRRRGLPPPAAAVGMLRHKGRTVVRTGLTTGIGFGSLVISALPSVRTLGAWSAVGIAFMTFAALVFYPALLTVMPGSGRRAVPAERRARQLGRGGAEWAVRHRRALLAGVAATSVLALFGLLRLRASDQVLDHFPPGDPVPAAIEALEARGIGAVSAELFLMPRRGAGEAPSLRGLEALTLQARLAEELRGEEGILGTVSAGDVVASTALYQGGEGDVQAALETIDGSLELGRLLRFFVTADGRRARVSLLVPMLGGEQLAPLFERARARAAELFPEHEVVITGRFPLVLAARRSLLRTMVGSFLLTFTAIAVIFRMILGSTGLTVRALIPNLWPILVVLGGGGWLGIPIDSATVMTASIVLGLAVDDTLHTLSSFRRVAGRLGATRGAIAAVGENAGAHTLSSALLVLGFGVVGFARLVPVARFGTFSAVAILLVLGADLLLVPALLAGSPAARDAPWRTRRPVGGATSRRLWL